MYNRLPHSKLKKRKYLPIQSLQFNKNVSYARNTFKYAEKFILSSACHGRASGRCVKMMLNVCMSVSQNASQARPATGREDACHRRGCLCEDCCFYAHKGVLFCIAHSSEKLEISSAPQVGERLS